MRKKDIMDMCERHFGQRPYYIGGKSRTWHVRDLYSGDHHVHYGKKDTLPRFVEKCLTTPMTFEVAVSIIKNCSTIDDTNPLPEVERGVVWFDKGDPNGYRKTNKGLVNRMQTDYYNNDMNEKMFRIKYSKYPRIAQAVITLR